MNATTKNGFTTTIVHRDRRIGMEHGSLRAPVHSSAQYGFEKVEDLIGIFQGTKKGSFNYSRQGTPTTALLEAKVNELEDGVGTACFATGMGAITAVFLSLLKAGDHLNSIRHVFGNTNSLLGTLQQLGIAVSMVDMTSAQAVADALTPATRMVFVETIANPGTQIADLEGIGALCRERGLVYVVDNTITSPALFKATSVEASLVVNSLSKTLSGHGAALGGAVTDTGRFDWAGYPNIADEYRSVQPPRSRACGKSARRRCATWAPRCLRSRRTRFPSAWKRWRCACVRPAKAPRLWPNSWPRIRRPAGFPTLGCRAIRSTSAPMPGCCRSSCGMRPAPMNSSTPSKCRSRPPGWATPEPW